MKKTFALIAAFALVGSICLQAQQRRYYDEKADPMAQIEKACATAAKEGKNVICQVGGNWCRWCIMFAGFIENDAEISRFVSDNYVYIHVNYDTQNPSEKLSSQLGYPRHFGFPCLVVIDSKGKLLHIQDSSFLEEGQGYDKEKVMRFFSCWTPSALSSPKL